MPSRISETFQNQLDAVLESCLDRLVEIAPLECPSQLAEILPKDDPTVARFVLVELIKMDMAIACESGATAEEPPCIERYLDQFGELLPLSNVPVDLVMEELQLRREIGVSIDAADYQRRFPQHRSVIGQLLGVAEATAAVQNRRGPPTVEIGEQIDDFLILQTLGSGAFANVYLARQVSMYRLVALKVSRGTGDEPQTLAQLDHPNIVRVFDQRGLADSDVHLLYMQYQPGGTLADVVARIRALGQSTEGLTGQVLLDAVDRQLLRAAQVVPERSSVREWMAGAPWPMVVAWIGLQLARALQDAHDRGVLHRDVKPANVLLSAEGIPKLADFNVSFAGVAGRAGAASSFGGSIGYMSPEHLRAINATGLSQPEAVAERSDIYALGILLWELWQGVRPFDTGSSPNSWTQAVTQQLAAREQPLVQPHRLGGVSERVLESALHHALQYAPEDRPGSGSEMAGRLKLALHPDAARLFDPDPDSWQGWLMRRSPWLVAAVVILVPNVLAMIYGYYYNYWESLKNHFENQVVMRQFNNLAACVNIVAVPLAVLLVFWYTRKVVHELQRVSRGEPLTKQGLDDTISLASRAGMIGGALWCVAAVLYPIALRMMLPEFTSSEASHFFVSHIICGGVAAIYPFFGMTVYATAAVYPRLVRVSMNDAQFDQRWFALVRLCEHVLLLACLIPLVGLALMVVSGTDSRGVMMTAVMATAAGLFAAFYAYRMIVRQWAQMSTVLSARGSSVVPTTPGDQSV
ncbi:Serine/threonine-protein kinase PrkC [Stieleria varia]|uniref:Serine/threonine-protein kinase PrkC n=1 Tax=Stieleria varia TaxID=2528005 RepID=A0A5C6A4R5_9BACT|nr:Serine/threonine-protein kinase PrkC [Stieleria varia]